MSTAVLLNTSKFNFAIASTYCPPNKPISQNDFQNLFTSLGPRFLCGGDYNAKHPQWGCRVANRRGPVLLDAVSSSHYAVISPSEFTYFPYDHTKLPDLLDYFVTHNLNHIHSDIKVLKDLSSDHCPILLTLDTSPLPKPTKAALIKGPIDWNKFQTSLDSKTDLTLPLKTPHQIDEAVNQLTTNIQQSVYEATGPTTPKNRSTTNVPQQIKTLLTAKRRARARWQLSRYPSDKRTYNRLCRDLTRILRQYRVDKFNDYTESLTTKNKSLWTATKKLLSYKPISSPLRRADGSWASSDEEKALCFSEHLSTVFNPHPDISDPSHTDMIDADLDIPLQLTPPPPAFHPSDITFLIKFLPNKKAPGKDLITSTILKHLP